MQTPHSNDARSSGDTVSVERYTPNDRRGVLDLDKAVWERERPESWFAWKYEENPYISHPAVFVAKADGRVVGARPFMVFRLRTGERTVIALQPADTMVHPDYRGRGVFTEMTKRAIGYYESHEPELCFNFPNDMSWPGYRKLGWRAVDTRTTFYRIQNPAALGSLKVDRDIGQTVGRLARLPVRAYYEFQSRSARTSDEFAVERRADLPVETLVDLYRQRVPSRIHAQRDEAFYRWRFASPLWRQHTYVATSDGDEAAAVVTRTRTIENGLTVTQLVDVAPLTGGKRWSDALAALIDRIIADCSESDLLAAHETPIPKPLLATYGFLANAAPPLSWFTSSATFAVRPLGPLDESAWDVDGKRLTDPSNWCLSFSERDTA